MNNRYVKKTYTPRYWKERCPKKQAEEIKKVFSHILMMNEAEFYNLQHGKKCLNDLCLFHVQSTINESEMLFMKTRDEFLKKVLKILEDE